MNTDVKGEDNVNFLEALLGVAFLAGIVWMFVEVFNAPRGKETTTRGFEEENWEE